MATEHPQTPTEYIAHHLTFNKSGEGFWAFHWDTIAVSVLVGVLALGFLRWVVSDATSGVPGKRQAFVELLIDFIDDQVKDVVETSEAAIQAAGVGSADEVRLQSRALVRYSPKRRLLNLELRKYLYQNLYYNPEVHEPNRRAVQMLEELFRYFSEHPRQISELFRKRARKDGWPRAVCDYLACMTDRYAIQEHQRLFGLKV